MKRVVYIGNSDDILENDKDPIKNDNRCFVSSTFLNNFVRCTYNIYRSNVFFLRNNVLAGTSKPTSLNQAKDNSWRGDFWKEFKLPTSTNKRRS